MKLKSVTSTIESSNTMETGTFSIKGSGKAFQILSSGLYSDKILAVIRELSCNASDAMVAAGKGDQPIEVHLPNNIEPYFAVRDTGIGMSHNDVLKLYTTYFESTKSDSNDFIGALGLGSKSPFSYTSSFTVTSIFNGERRVYTAAIDSDFLPQINLMHEEVTDEANGVEVRVAVKHSDIFEFMEKARKIYFYFKVKPKIVASPSRFEHLGLGKAIHETGGFTIFHHSGSHPHQHAIVMGSVGYPLDLSQLEMDEKDVKLLQSFATILEVPLGSADVAASREAISYDKETIENLNALLTPKIQEVHSQIQADLDSRNFRTVWDCVKEFGKYHAVFPDLQFKGEKVFDYVASHVSYSGTQNISLNIRSMEIEKFLRPFTKPNGMFDKLAFDEATCSKYRTNEYDMRFAMILDYIKDCGVQMWSFRKRQFHPNSFPSHSIYPKNTKFIHDDMPEKPKGNPRIRQAMNAFSKYNDAYVFRGDRATIVHILEEVFNIPEEFLTKASELPEVEKNEARTPNRICYIYNDAESSRRAVHSFEALNVAMDEENDCEWLLTDDEISPEMKLIKLINPTGKYRLVYCAPSGLERLKKKTGLSKTLKEEFVGLVDSLEKPMLRASVGPKGDVKSVSNEIRKLGKILTKEAAELDPNIKIIYTVYESWVEHKFTSPYGVDADDIHDRYVLLTNSSSLNVPGVDVSKIFNSMDACELYERFPLLSGAFTNYGEVRNEKTKEHINKYLQMVLNP